MSNQSKNQKITKIFKWYDPAAEGITAGWTGHDDAKQSKRRTHECRIHTPLWTSSGWKKNASRTTVRSPWTRGGHVIHCLTVIGQIEGHSEAPQGQKTTKYEHVIPQLVAVQEDPRIEGLLVLLNTVGGDVEAGLALAELIASVSKPSATLVLGGGHSIGIPLAVSAQRSFIVPTATMTVHPVRHSGVILGVPQTISIRHRPELP